METGFFTESAAQEAPQGVYKRAFAGGLMWRAPFVIGILLLLASNHVAMAQQRMKLADLPDAPTPKVDASDPPQQAQKGTLDNTIGVLSRRSVFFPDLAYQKGPLNSGQKLALAADVSISPSRIVASAFIGAINQASNSPEGYGQGWDAYGKRFGAFLATSASEDMFGTFLLPSIFRQDPRYFVRPNAGFKRRVGNAVRRVFVTRTDSGGEAFNISGILGTMMAEGLANSYLPDAERTAGKTFQRTGIRIGVTAASDILKEYWPNIFKSLGMRRLVKNGAAPPDSATSPNRSSN